MRFKKSAKRIEDERLRKAGKANSAAGHGSGAMRRIPHRADQIRCCYRLTEYLVNAPPACASEFGPSAA